MKLFFISVFTLFFVSKDSVAQEINEIESDRYFGASIVLTRGDGNYKIPLEIYYALIRPGILSFKIKAGYDSYAAFGVGANNVSSLYSYASNNRFNYLAKGYYLKFGIPLIKIFNEDLEYACIFYDDISYTSHNLEIIVNDPIYGNSTAYLNSKNILSFVSGLELENSFIFFPTPSFGIIASIGFGIKSKSKPFDNDIQGLSYITNYNSGTIGSSQGSSFFNSITFGLVYRLDYK